MKQVLLWRAVQFTCPISVLFSVGLCGGLIGPDTARGGAVFVLAATYFFLVAHVAAVQASTKATPNAFDWFQLICYWISSVCVVGSVLTQLSSR